jgi:gas vesicle protein
MRLSSAATHLRNAAAALAAPPDMPPEVVAIEADIGVLLQAMSQMEASLEATLGPLQSLVERLGQDLLDDLHDRIETEASNAEEAFDAAINAFEALGVELVESAVEEAKDWLEDSLESLGGKLSAAAEDIKHAAADGVKNLQATISNGVANLGEDVNDRIAQKSRDAANEVVEAATERALTEIAETLVTTQMGATVTSAIGPYLPAIMVIRPALPAIQDALDLMRGGI